METTLFDVGSFFWPKLKHDRLSFTLFSACVRKKIQERESIEFLRPTPYLHKLSCRNKNPLPPLQRIFLFCCPF